jgi:Flp pilus assembly protein TadD
MALAKLGRLQEAIQTLEEAVRLDPNETGAIKSLSIL